MIEIYCHWVSRNTYFLFQPKQRKAYMNLSKWLVLLLALTLTIASKVNAFDHCKVLSTSPLIELKWNLLPDSTTQIAIQSSVAGNLALGLSAKGHHNSMDLWTISGANDPKCLKDCIVDASMKNGQITVDSHQNLLNPTLTETMGNGMLAEFNREMNTHDKNDVSLSKGPLSLFWVFSTNQSLTSELPLFNGPISIDFEKPSTCSVNAEMNSQLNPDIRAPAPVFTPLSGPTFTSPGGDFIIVWELNEALGEIRIEMKGRTTGWISMGFADKSTMNAADYYTGSVVKGKVTLLDTWSVGKDLPPNDKIQSALVTGFSQDTSYTTIQFKRKLNTNDKQDWELTNTDLTMMWALAPTARFAQKHSKYGSVRVNLFTGKMGGIGILDSGSLFAILIVFISIVILIVQVLKRARKSRVKREISSEEAESARKSVELPNISDEPIVEIEVETKSHKKFKYMTRLDDVEIEKKPTSCWNRCLGCCHVRIPCIDGHSQIDDLILLLGIILIDISTTSF